LKGREQMTRRPAPIDLEVLEERVAPAPLAGNVPAGPSPAADVRDSLNQAPNHGNAAFAPPAAPTTAAGGQLLLATPATFDLRGAEIGRTSEPSLKFPPSGGGGGQLPSVAELLSAEELLSDDLASLFLPAPVDANET
jgi:hypothetical protein